MVRFHWFQKEGPNQIEVLLFKRLVFSLVESPFILDGAIDEDLSSYVGEYSPGVTEIRGDLHAYDLLPSLEVQKTGKWDWSNFNKTTLRREIEWNKNAGSILEKRW